MRKLLEHRGLLICVNNVRLLPRMRIKDVTCDSTVAARSSRMDTNEILYVTTAKLSKTIYIEIITINTFGNRTIPYGARSTYPQYLQKSMHRVPSNQGARKALDYVEATPLAA